jgi:hypothetical protein
MMQFKLSRLGQYMLIVFAAMVFDTNELADKAGQSTGSPFKIFEYEDCGYKMEVI